METAAAQLRRTRVGDEAAQQTIDVDRLFPATRRGATWNLPTLSRLGVEIEIQPRRTAEFAAQLLERADGKTSMAQLAAAMDVAPDHLEQLSRELETHGFIWSSRPGELISTSMYLQEFRLWVDHWVEQVFSHPVWDDVVSGKASPAILVGWALESMHYTRTVAEHMTLAAARSRGLESQTIIRHFSEEWDHYLLFCDACAAVGIPKDRVLSAVPLVSTQAITTFMRRVASHDPLVYNGCEALLEATAKDPDSVVEFFRSAGSAHGYPREYVENIVSHVRADEDFQHIDIFDELLMNRHTIPRERANRILDACWTLTELLTLWHADIIRYYGQFDAVPFPPRGGLHHHSDLTAAARPNGSSRRAVST
jgi:hypothetical protein